MNMVNFLDDGRPRGGHLRDRRLDVRDHRPLARCPRGRAALGDRRRRLLRVPAPQLLSGADPSRATRALLLGFLLATLAIEGLVKTAALATLVLPLVLAIPIVDTSFVVAKRLKYRQPLYEADRTHLHHRFMNIGFSQKRAVVYMYAWCGSSPRRRSQRASCSAPRRRRDVSNALIAGGMALLAVVASVYIAYLLEIIKLANPRIRRREERARDDAPQRLARPAAASTAGVRPRHVCVTRAPHLAAGQDTSRGLPTAIGGQRVAKSRRFLAHRHRGLTRQCGASSEAASSAVFAEPCGFPLLQALVCSARNGARPRESLDPAGAGAVLLGTTVAGIGIGALVGWLAGAPIGASSARSSASPQGSSPSTAATAGCTREGRPRRRGPSRTGSCRWPEARPSWRSRCRSSSPPAGRSAAGRSARSSGSAPRHSACCSHACSSAPRTFAASGVRGVGMMFRPVAVMVVVIVVAASNPEVGLAAGAVYALAYTLELGLSLLAYFEIRRTDEARARTSLRPRADASDLRARLDCRGRRRGEVRPSHEWLLHD